jgi:hypothetical protein
MKKLIFLFLFALVSPSKAPSDAKKQQIIIDKKDEDSLLGNLFEQEQSAEKNNSEKDNSGNIAQAQLPETQKAPESLLQLAQFLAGEKAMVETNAMNQSNQNQALEKKDNTIIEGAEPIEEEIIPISDPKLAPSELEKQAEQPNALDNKGPVAQNNKAQAQSLLNLNPHSDGLKKLNQSDAAPNVKSLTQSMLQELQLPALSAAQLIKLIDEKKNQIPEPGNEEEKLFKNTLTQLSYLIQLLESEPSFQKYLLGHVGQSQELGDFTKMSDLVQNIKTVYAKSIQEKEKAARMGPLMKQLLQFKGSLQNKRPDDLLAMYVDFQRAFHFNAGISQLLSNLARPSINVQRTTYQALLNFLMTYVQNVDDSLLDQDLVAVMQQNALTLGEKLLPYFKDLFQQLTRNAYNTKDKERILNSIDAILRGTPLDSRWKKFMQDKRKDWQGKYPSNPYRTQNYGGKTRGKNYGYGGGSGVQARHSEARNPLVIKGLGPSFDFEDPRSIERLKLAKISEKRRMAELQKSEAKPSAFELQKKGKKQDISLKKLLQENFPNTAKEKRSKANQAKRSLQPMTSEQLPRPWLSTVYTPYAKAPCVNGVPIVPSLVPFLSGTPSC